MNYPWYLYNNFTDAIQTFPNERYKNHFTRKSLFTTYPNEL